MLQSLNFTGQCTRSIEAHHESYTTPALRRSLRSPEEVAWARRVVATLVGQPGDELGVALLDGQLIEAPHLARARRILALANATKLGPAV